MALSITVHGQGTFTASMEEGPVTFTAAIASVGPQGATGPTGPAGVVAATAPITYNSGTQTVGISATPTFTSVTATTGNLTTVNLTTATFADATSQTTAFIGEARKGYITARNNNGYIIPKGSVVYLSGATGNKPTIALAIATSEATSSRTIGITSEAIAINADGKVIISGAVENIDTSAFNDGDVVHLSATTAGGMTTTLPTAPLHGVVIGIVTRANPSVGSIEVAINNYQELKELSDVAVSDRANNDGLFWESSSSTWRSKTIAEILGYTPANNASVLLSANNLSDLGSASTARTNLGLGTMAVETASNYLTTSAAATTYYPIPTGTTSQYLRGNGTLSTFSTDVIAAVPSASTTTAGKVELATDAEAIAGTSATLAITPASMTESFLFPGRFMWATAFTAATSGTGATTLQAGQDAKQILAPTTAAGYALLRSLGTIISRGLAYNAGVAWGRRQVLGFRMALRTTATDANSVFRVTFGKTTTDNAGDLARRGIGIKGIGGGVVQLQVHNGTTLTTVNSTFTPDNTSFDVEIVSDVGTVTLYINGSQVATTTAGPTAGGGTVEYCLQAEAENTTSITGTRMIYEIVNFRSIHANS